MAVCDRRDLHVVDQVQVVDVLDADAARADDADAQRRGVGDTGRREQQPDDAGLPLPQRPHLRDVDCWKR